MGAALTGSVRSAVLAFAFATLIAPVPRGAFAQVIDAAPAGDADPGPRLPNGEPAPERDLVTDAGGISCQTAGPLATPLPATVLLLALLRRRRR
jgi:uncharacterized protein (TIGR03382 family)